MREADVEVILERAREKFPEAKARVLSDNGPQFDPQCVLIHFLQETVAQAVIHSVKGTDDSLCQISVFILHRHAPCGFGNRG